MSSAAPVELFISFAHEDEALRHELTKHLAALKRQGIIRAWHDREITAGAEWDSEINQHLDRARIILLLVSPDFMASDYCNDVKVERALARHERGEGLRQVQLRLLSSPNQSHPFYWASFIHSGEWADMEGRREAAPKR